jgi:type I restriction enzyme S subunit
MKDSAKAGQNKKRSIPKDWDTINLGERGIFEVIMGQSPPSSTYNKENHGLPFLQGKMEFGEIFPSPLVYCSKPIKIAEKNDILISVRAPVGDVNISASKLCIGRGLASIRCNSQKILYLFLFYFMKYKSKKFENISSGSTFKAIRRSELDNFEVLLPPLNEQKKIAEIFGTVDQSIEKVEEAIGTTQTLKKGLIQELLIKGIGHKEFKETEIGRIPKEWKIKKFEDFSLDFIGGGTPSTTNKKYWNGDIAWMTSAYIDDKEIINGQRYITKEGLKNSATNIVPKDNLIVATRVGIGKAAINRIDIAISQDLTGVIIAKEQADMDFLYWQLINNENKLKSLAQGSTIKGILREDLGKIKIPFPPLSEQQRIAEILSSVDKRIKLLRNRKERLGRVKKGLMEDLLTGRKRVKLES